MNNNLHKPGIETLFRKLVRKDPKVKNAYLLVHSNNTGLHINLAEGSENSDITSPQQPNYMASVSKLFTSVIIGILHEKGFLSFKDSISKYLEPELMENLHIYNGKDYSSDIQVRHLLNQTSGLPDNFYPLLEKLLADHKFEIEPREAVEWTKNYLKPKAQPGKKTYYTDTNYHLLGLIIENIYKKPFHVALKELIFNPIGMKQSYMLHYSEPEKKSQAPEAGFYFAQTRFNDIKGLANIDYAGGGIVAPLEDLLLFMEALVEHQLVSEETLKIMKNDKSKINFGFEYGYSIWQVRTIPLLLPVKYKSWGVLGATGAFMFYHPELNTYFIGNFNHIAWQKKCVRFMFKVMDKLSE